MLHNPFTDSVDYERMSHNKIPELKYTYIITVYSFRQYNGDSMFYCIAEDNRKIRKRQGSLA